MAGSSDGGFGAGRLSRAGRGSTGLPVLHSSHQCRWALLRRLRIPQLSQTKTSFLTRTECLRGRVCFAKPLFEDPTNGGAIQTPIQPKKISFMLRKKLASPDAI